MALRAASSVMSYVGPNGCTHSRPVTQGRGGACEPDPKAVREWAAEQGIDVPARGVVPAKVVAAYKTAHPGSATEYAPDFLLTCAVCEPTLTDHELWGPADKPAPLTRDEQANLEAQQKDANRSILESIAAMPGMIEVLQSLVNKVR